MEPFCQFFLISNFLKMNSIAQAVDLVKQTLRPLEEMDFSLHGDHKLRDGDGDERLYWPDGL